jgi:hypothetical protein
MSEPGNVVPLNPQSKKGNDEVLLWICFWPDGGVANDRVGPAGSDPGH